MASPHLSDLFYRKLLVFAVASLPAMQYARKEFDPAEMTDETVKQSFNALPHLLDHLIQAEDALSSFNYQNIELLSNSLEQISNAEENSKDGREVEANVGISTPGALKFSYYDVQFKLIFRNEDMMIVDVDPQRYENIHPPLSFYAEPYQNTAPLNAFPTLSLQDTIPNPISEPFTFIQSEFNREPFVPSELYQPADTFYAAPWQTIPPLTTFFGEVFQNIPPSTTFYHEPHLTPSFHQDQWQNIQPYDFYEPQLTSFYGEPWLNPTSSSIAVNQVQPDSIHYQPSDMIPSVHNQGLLTRGDDPESDPGGGGGPQQGPNVANWDPNCNRGSRDTAHTAEGEQDRLWERANPGLLRRGAHEFLTEITGGSRRGTATALATVIYMWNNSNIRKDLDWSANDINNTTQLCRHWGFAYKNAALMVVVCHMNLARLSNDPM
ncbi:hypothetical protein BD410DRAFT_846045 [Rickenella mellea]|uniref:Uncharacterized protein n=1 Tax=Rickenella mellea TaxID=50990 RepID=A0A4Y7PHD2_9AGAM|nr:hypothetical protein BD410DRAFT_846045 [Rickenella mellea]